MTPPTSRSSQQAFPLGRGRAWAVWGVAVAIYALAVFHRSSLGVAGILAADRFGITAAELASFTVLQLIIYAGMQVPVGVLLDKFGPRKLLIAGLLVMTLAQLAFAFVTSYGAALVARGFIGAGDALVFVTVLRLATSWFRPTQVPMVTQITGWVGQFGAIVAAAPLTLLLTHLGWTRAFAVASSAGVVLLVATLMVVRDSPHPGVTKVSVSLGELARSVRRVWANPGTRLGFWVHFTTQFPFTVFVLLWGVPFLVRGQGWSEVAAGTLLMAMTGWVVVSGIAIGMLTSRRPFHRSWLAVAVVVTITVSYTIVLALDEPAPVWLLLVLGAAIATGGPASMIGFDLARTFNPVSAVGRANGLVNVGGFAASLVVMGLIGVVLDLVEPGGMEFYELNDFRIALAAHYLGWGLGLVQIIRLRRRAVDHLDREHPGATDALRSGSSWTTQEP